MATRTDFSLSEELIVQGSTEGFLSQMDAAAEAYVAQVMPQIFASLSLVTSAFGNVHDAGGQPFSWDMFLDTHYLVEVKRDKDMETAEVQGKREAALRWANHVSASPKLNGVQWRYVLLSEADVADGKGSWQAMKLLGQ